MLKVNSQLNIDKNMNSQLTTDPFLENLLILKSHLKQPRNNKLKISSYPGNQARGVVKSCPKSQLPVSQSLCVFFITLHFNKTLNKDP